MKDPILKSLGWKWKREPTGEEIDMIIQHTYFFARAGGVLTWDLWSKMRSQTKAAMIAGFEKAYAERAAAIGLASQGKQEAARIMAESDGGDLQAQVALDQFVARYDRRDRGFS